MHTCAPRLLSRSREGLVLWNQQTPGFLIYLKKVECNWGRHLMLIFGLHTYLHMVITDIDRPAKQSTCLWWGMDWRCQLKWFLHLSIEPPEGRWHSHSKVSCNSHIVHQRGMAASRAVLSPPEAQHPRALTFWEETGWNQVNKYNSGFIKNQSYPAVPS